MTIRALLLFLAVAISACSPLSVMQDTTDHRALPSTPDDGGNASPSATAELLEKSRTEVAAGQYPQAAASIERALRIEPGNPYLWLELAQIHLVEGNVRQAETHARKALSLVGDDEAANSATQEMLDRIEN